VWSDPSAIRDGANKVSKWQRLTDAKAFLPQASDGHRIREIARSRLDGYDSFIFFPDGKENVNRALFYPQLKQQITAISSLNSAK
jgi:hypothetical protein